MSDPAPLRGVLETCLYHEPSQREAVERFYGATLGLERVARWPDGMAFRIGAGVVLLFDRAKVAERDGPIAAHGSSGPGHACLVVAAPGDYDAWKTRIADRGVEITHEHEWGDERRSFYFADPAGNLLEIADGDLWPR
jgi:catechol 2,3-dioxygenase-like lactoylglutathione lyase family enzyme